MADVHITMPREHWKALAYAARISAANYYSPERGVIRDAIVRVEQETEK